MSSKSLLLIGAGKMGSGILARLIKKDIFDPARVTVVERESGRRNALDKKITVVETIQAVHVEQFDVILLAIKPQDAPQLFAALGENKIHSLVISIMAGISCRQIKRSLGSVRILRGMPNLPVLIGEGVTAWYADDCTHEDSETAQTIFGALGKEFEVASESEIDKITAISGCGPGYVYALADDLIKAAVGLGLDEKHSREIVRQTIAGAAKLYAQSGKEPEVLIDEVASKGGATAAALDLLRKKNTAEIWKQAVQKAFERTRTLGEDSTAK